MQDFTQTLRDRLHILIEQVQRDRAALDPAQHPDGDQVFAQLFDSLQSTLHNLDVCTEERPQPLDDVF